MNSSLQVNRTRRRFLALIGTVGVIGLCVWLSTNTPNIAQGPEQSPFNAQVGPADWPQFGGTPLRNNTPEGTNIPLEWHVKSGKNIKWSAKLGSQTWGNPVVANGKVFVGTNNGAGYLKRNPSKIDLGVLLCFRESDGEFLWQHSSKKLPSGRVHDYPLQGICSTPVVEGDRLWCVTNRGEVICLDAEGFRDGANDGPFSSEKPEKPDVDWDEPQESDIVWKFDMMGELGVRQHNMATCSPTIRGDVLFVCTSNGVDEGHKNIPAPDAPSFMAMEKHTGKVLWTDKSPGNNILHSQWSSPAIGVFNGVPQVLFGGGDGWLYGFRADRGNNGQPELLWKFDGNPKSAQKMFGARSTRNQIVATPAVYDGLVYLSMGEDPEHGEGQGHLWCIDPTKRGDLSSELVVDQNGNTVPHQRFDPLAPIGLLKPKAVANPNSGAVWHYDGHDLNGDGKHDSEETMHRTVCGPAIKNNLLLSIDISGILHCLDAKTGKPYWTHDTLDTAYGSPLIVNGHVYCGTENGDIKIFERSKVKKQVAEINMDNSVYTMPIVANNTLYIANKERLFAIFPGLAGKKMP